MLEIISFFLLPKISQLKTKQAPTNQLTALQMDPQDILTPRQLTTKSPPTLIT
jgi:hypothetical protein